MSRAAGSRDGVSDYGTRDVAALLGLSVAQVRSYVRAELVAPARGPVGEFRFSFQDIAVLRTARALMDAHVPPRRVRRALGQLRQQLPAAIPLSAVSIDVNDGHILVRDASTVWNPESGQTQLDFAESPPVSKVTTLDTRRRDRLERAWNEVDAADWFDLGLDLEAISIADAQDAYRQALHLDPTHAGAHVNLGRLLHDAGRMQQAERHYRDALRHDPHNATAAFNLGIVLEDAGRPREAVAAYEQALSIDSAYADAHFNLACAYEALGDSPAALRHMLSYKRLRGTP